MLKKKTRTVDDALLQRQDMAMIVALAAWGAQRKHVDANEGHRERKKAQSLVTCVSSSRSFAHKKNCISLPIYCMVSLHNAP